MTLIHIDWATVLVAVLFVLSGPLAVLLSGWRERARAESVKLRAEAESIRNPVLRTLATEAAEQLPNAVDLAVESLLASRDHVVSEVSRVNPQAGSLVGTIIDTALASPPAPLPSPHGVIGSPLGVSS